jgi:hypothetical protein
MAAVRYLVDTCVFARPTKPTVAATLAPPAASRLVAVNAPVVFELGISERSPADYQQLTDGLGSFPSVPTTDADHQRAHEVQRHRRPASSSTASRSRWGMASRRSAAYRDRRRTPVDRETEAFPLGAGLAWALEVMA